MDWAEYQSRIARLKAALYVLAAFIAFGGLFQPDIRAGVQLAPAMVLIAAALPAALVIYLIPWPTSRPNSFLIVHAVACLHLAVFLFVTGGGDSPFWSIVMFIVVSAAAYYREEWPVYVVTALAAGVVLSPILYEEPALATKAIRVAVTVISLVVARKMFITMAHSALRAQQLAHTRSAFLMALSHQLRTPLTALRLGIGAAKEVVDTRQQGSGEATALEYAEKSAKEISDAVEEIIELFRIAGEGTILDLTHVDLRDEARTLIDTYRDQIQRKEIDVSLEGDLLSAVVLADQRLVRLALSNLLKNAIEFTPHGGSISLRMTKEDEKLRVTLEDTGPGIPESVRAQLFLPYVSGEHNRLPDQRLWKGGLGLGLMTAKAIVEDHGGELEVGDGSAGGTAVTFTLFREPPTEVQAR